MLIFCKFFSYMDRSAFHGAGTCSRRLLSEIDRRASQIKAGKRSCPPPGEGGSPPEEGVSPPPFARLLPFARPGKRRIGRRLPPFFLKKGSFRETAPQKPERIRSRPCKFITFTACGPAEGSLFIHTYAAAPLWKRRREPAREGHAPRLQVKGLSSGGDN